MQSEEVINLLRSNIRVYEGLFQGVETYQARWRPAPDKWSLLEVVNHLYDEERDDFRAHLTLLLENKGQAWKGIDPRGWVTERKYNEREFAESISNFISERNASLAWLDNLDDPKWERFYSHPHFGSMAAGDMLASWAAHDLLHIRQIVNCKLAFLVKIARPFSINYASPAL